MASPLLAERLAVIVDEAFRRVAAAGVAPSRLEAVAKVMHELGHQLGMVDTMELDRTTELMFCRPEPGVRKMLNVASIDTLFGGQRGVWWRDSRCGA